MDQLFREPIGIRPADLSGLSFRMARPHSGLQPWIELYYSIHGQSEGSKRQSFNLYPDGGSTLSFALFHGEVVGLRLSFSNQLCQANFPDPRHCLSVRFRPGGAFALLGVSAEDFDQPLDEQDHPALYVLMERLKGRPFTVEPFAVLDRLFLAGAKTMESRHAIIQQWLNHFPEHPRILRDVLSRQGIQRPRPVTG